MGRKIVVERNKQRSGSTTTENNRMSNKERVVAVLCAKANDAAFANEISIAADRFDGKDDSIYQEANPAEFIATLCVTASAFHLEDHHLDPSTSEAPKESICPLLSSSGHKIANLHPESLPALFQGFETFLTDDDSPGKDDVFHLKGSTRTCHTTSEDDSSSSSLMDDEPHHLQSKQEKKLVPKLHDGIAANTHPRSSNYDVANSTADVVAAALFELDELPEKSQGAAKVGKRGGRRCDKFNATKLPKPPRKRVTRKLSSSRRRKLDNPTCSSDDSTHTPSDDGISVDKEGDSKAEESEPIPSDGDLNAIGWNKALDPASGNYYYYTEDGNDVVWDNPLSVKN